MDAEVVVRSPDGTRTIPLGELFEGPFETSLGPTEIITEVRVPDPGPNAGGTYLKLERKVGDFATVGVAVHLSMADGKVGRAGIALTAVGPTNLRATAAEAALAGSELTDAAIREAARLAAEAAQPYSDTRGTADYKRTVVRVFTERGLRAAAEAVGHPVPGRSAADGAPRTTEEALEATDRQDYFSGERTIAGVMDELEDKPGGPDGGER
jgi:carbon-monoxide dehydrogenase medium subunit